MRVKVRVYVVSNSSSLGARSPGLRSRQIVLVLSVGDI